MDAKEILEKKLPTTEEEMATMMAAYRGKMDLLTAKLALWQGIYMSRASQYAIDLEAKIYALQQANPDMPYNKAESEAKHALAGDRALRDKAHLVSKTYLRIYEKWRREEWTRT